MKNRERIAQLEARCERLEKAAETIYALLTVVETRIPQYMWEALLQMYPLRPNRPVESTEEEE